MAVCVEKLPHECGSSDALQIFEDNDGGYTGYCFSCDTYVPDPYGGGKPSIKAWAYKEPKDIEAEIEEISTYSIVALPTRSLAEETLKWFDVRVGKSEQDGLTPVSYYFPFYRNGRPIGFKAKLVPVKKQWNIGDFKGQKDLFGWKQALDTGAKRLFITEGEEDACALYQVLVDKQAGTQWEGFKPAVVSLTAGATSVKKDISSHLPMIRHNFKEVVFVFDMDEAGAKARRDALTIIPTAHTVDLPEKDANECVMKGKGKALANACLFKSSTPKNTRIVLGSSLYHVGRESAPHGLSYPWEGLTHLTRGMRFGETYYLGAGVKMGKTTIRNALAVHLIKEHGLKVFMAAPEETNKKSWKLACGQAAGRIFHDPEIEFDFDAYDKASEDIGDSIYLLDLYQHLGWDSLRSDIMVAAEEGCKVVFIDPITNLTSGIPSGDANTALQEIAQELSAIALDLDLIVWIFCHLKAPLNGPAHERGGLVISNQFAGSRAMMQKCHMMLGLEGNKDPDLDIEIRNQRRLIVLEDREFGASGYINTFYNENSGLYKEIESG